MKTKLIAFLVLFGIHALLKAQTADLMDVRFQSGGSAKNLAVSSTISPLAITTPSLVPNTIYEPSINQFVSRFDGTGGNTSGAIYKLSYKDNSEFKAAIAGSFTIEAYIKSNSTANKCPISAQESGGFGMEQASGTAGKMQFWYNSTNKTAKAGDVSISNSTQYHHIVYVVSRSDNNATITAYYNGVVGGTDNVTTAYKEPSNADAHWIAIGGDAHPTYASQYYWNGDIAFTRMYSSALSATEVSRLYGEVTARNALTKVGDLNTVIGTKLPAYIGFTTDAGKKTIAQTLLNEGWDLMGNLTATDTDIQTYLDKINTNIGSLEPEVNTLPVFAVISDTHVGNDKGWALKLNRGIDQLLAQSPKLDAVFINGDVTDWGTQAQYTDAKNLFARLEAAVPVYYLMGNHDWFTSGANNFFTNTLGQPVNQYITIKGYPFITISMERSTYPDAYTQPSQDFLTEKIAQAKIDCPGKPIFVFAHMPVTGTVYGSYTIGGNDNWGTAGLKAICETNQEVILFSGHSHYPLGDERSIHQDKFTSINEGSMTYSEIETGKSEGIHPPGYLDVTEGCFVYIQNNGDVKVKRWDFTRKEEIKTPWIIKAPFTTANFTYKNRTGGTAPYFLVNDKPSVSNVTDNACTVSFPQGKDDDLVHHYVIEVMDENNVVLSSPKYRVFSGFFLNSATPSQLTWNVTGLAFSKKYAIRVTGIDSYGNVSVPPIISNQFTTNAYQVDPGAVLAIADLLDVKFKEGGDAIDVSAKQFTVAKGSTLPSTLYDAGIKQYINRSNGTASQYFKVDYQNDAAFKTSLQNAFTLETYVKTSSTGTIAPVSSQETGGFGIEQASGGDTEFWFRKTTGSYDRISVGQLATGQYYHLIFTWDNSTKKLMAYRNGVYVTEKILTSSDGLVFSSSASAQWIGIGGDAHTSANVQSSFRGDIATTRMYSKALSTDEVFLAYQQLQARTALTKFDDLNTALIATIPNSAIGQTQKNALLVQGWQLMGNLATTDADINTFLANLNTTLPVSITSFSAKANGSQINLNWTTASEQHSAYFNVMRSTDGQNFNKIGEVKAVGNSNVERNYYFTDFNPAPGTNYYKLNQYDLNGILNAQEQVATAKVAVSSITLSIYGNVPNAILVNIYAPKAITGYLMATGANGQKINSLPIVLAEGNNKIELPVGTFKGLIIVTLSAAEVKLSKKMIR